MIAIELTQGCVTTIDDEDADLAAAKWCVTARRRDYGRYVQRRDPGKGRPILMHRVILERILGGPIPSGMHTDHIDGNRLNNCRSNLRVATPSQNYANGPAYRKQGRTSRYRGVCYDRSRGKWKVTVGGDGHQQNIGRFSTEIEAARAYDVAARKFYGEFAHLNNPEE